MLSGQSIFNFQTEWFQRYKYLPFYSFLSLTFLFYSQTRRVGISYLRILILLTFQSFMPTVVNGTEPDLPRCQSSSFLDASPFFRMAPSRFQSQQILFLTEFSRFMNRHAPTMMKVSTLH